MKRKTVKMIALGFFALALALGAVRQSRAQDAKIPYPSMAPLDQYLIADRNAEIALARTAAPPVHFPRCESCGPRAARL